MMKWAAAVGLSVLFLGGCSLLDEANSTLTYTKDMTDFLAETQQFAEEVPALLEGAAENPNLVEDIQAELESLKQEIDGVQMMDAPALAEGVHGKLLEYTAQLEESINNALGQIENGAFDPSLLLENTELLQTIQELQALKENIEQLGK